MFGKFLLVGYVPAVDRETNIVHTVLDECNVLPQTSSSCWTFSALIIFTHIWWFSSKFWIIGQMKSMFANRLSKATSGKTVETTFTAKLTKIRNHLKQHRSRRYYDVNKRLKTLLHFDFCLLNYPISTINLLQILL